ncbi:MAG: hypothetical protein QOC56_692 [Alphaproteobacteria bacterium]|jgi:hypothetical protein|nr:hypothetical protein [Alphaproteobacteria bacterium]MEA2937188.1 hypothetical protein [Alphaproteobacteria bacterium]
MDPKKFVAKAASLLPGPFVAFIQHWYNIFDKALISHPEWSDKTGSFSVALGSVSILYIIVIWDELSKAKKYRYLKYSFIVFAVSVALCLLFHLVVTITLFPGPVMFHVVVWLWYITFIIFGISLAHFLAAVVLYRLVR